VARLAPLMTRYRQFTERIFERIRSPPSGVRRGHRRRIAVAVSADGPERRTGDTEAIGRTRRGVVRDDRRPSQRAVRTGRAGGWPRNPRHRADEADRFRRCRRCG
jgi:hypothetical protein